MKSIRNNMWMRKLFMFLLDVALIILSIYVSMEL